MGTFAAVPWDAEDTALPKSGFAHSNTTNPDQIVVSAAGRFIFSGAISLRAILLFTGLAARLTVNGIAVPPEDWRRGLSLVLGDEVTASVSGVRNLSGGDVVRLEVASYGVGTVSLVAGPTRTFLQLAAL